MKIAGIAAAVALTVATGAGATTYVVEAAANSSSGGTPMSSISILAGHAFSVSASTDSLWSAGALPRFSDANGLTGDRFATASDDSGQTPGTLIGTNFGGYTQDGFTAPYGALVGRIGSTYVLLGTSYRGVAAETGTLELFYWDSNSGDNTGDISFNISAVPEPATWAMMIGGLALTGLGLRRRRAAVAA